MGIEFQFYKKRSSGDDGGDGCTTLNVLNAAGCQLKMVKMVSVRLCVYFSTMKKLEKNSSAKT